MGTSPGGDGVCFLHQSAGISPSETNAEKKWDTDPDFKTGGTAIFVVSLPEASFFCDWYSGSVFVPDGYVTLCLVGGNIRQSSVFHAASDKISGRGADRVWRAKA